MTIRVFLADDHAVVRDGLRFLLEAAGDITVIGDAANGREAVQRVTRLRPDVAVLDVAMPELNGIEATRQILERAPEVKIIILSMHSAAEHIAGALKAGARGYLLKESAGVEVAQAVHMVQHGQRYLSAKITSTLIDDYLSQSTEWRDPLERLTSREREILQLVAEGRTSNQIAQQLNLSIKTIDTYRSRIMHKINVTDLAGLIRFAIQHGLIGLEP